MKTELLLALLPILPAAADWQVVSSSEIARPEEPASLGGIAFVSNETYLAVTDWGAAIWEMHLPLDRDSGEPTNCVLRKMCSLEKRTDVEAIALDPLDPRRVFVADEFANTIGLHSLTNGKSVGEIRMSGALAKTRTDYGLESVALSRDGRHLWTCSEEAVEADGPLSTRDCGTDVRLARFRRDGAAWHRDGEWIYRTDAIAGLEWHGGANSKGESAAYTRSGVTDLCVMSDGTLLALEREFSILVFLPRFRARVYALDLAQASDVSNLSSVTNQPIRRIEKKLVFETSGFAMYEGLCQGPDFANGDATLVLVSDGDDLPTESACVVRLKRQP